MIGTGFDQGLDALKAMDKAKIPIDAAFWLMPEDEWVLCVYTPLIHRGSKSGIYKKIQSALRRSGNPLKLREISLIGRNDETLTALRSMFSMDLGGREYGEFRVTNANINGVFVKDAVIYRI